jgi:hypothetical protein
MTNLLIEADQPGWKVVHGKRIYIVVGLRPRPTR